MIACSIDSSRMMVACDEFMALAEEFPVQCRAFAELSSKKDLVDTTTADTGDGGITIVLNPSAMFLAFLESLRGREEIGAEGLR